MTLSHSYYNGLQYGFFKFSSIKDFNIPSYYDGPLSIEHFDITNLIGSPKVVTQYFSIKYNRLNTFYDSPKVIGITIIAESNNLFSFDFLPTFVGVDYIEFPNSIFY